MRAWVKLSSFRDGRPIAFDVADVERVSAASYYVNKDGTEERDCTVVIVSGTQITVTEPVEEILRLMREAELRAASDEVEIEVRAHRRDL